MNVRRTRTGVCFTLSLAAVSLLGNVAAQAQTVLGTTASGAIISPPSTPFERATGNFVTIPTTVTLPNGTVVAGEQRLPLPQILRWPNVPTDFTGPGGSLGHAQDIRRRILGPDRNTVPDSKRVIVARDPRYSFTRRWRPFIEQQVALVAPDACATPSEKLVVLQQAAVIAPVAGARLDRELQIPGFDFGDGQPAGLAAMVMPTAGAELVATAPDALTLNNGGVLIKTGEQAAYVTVPLANNQRATVGMRPGSIAMISQFNGHLTVANLHDSQKDGVVVAMNDSARCLTGAMPLRIGYMTEIYGTGAACPQNELVAYTVLNRDAFSNGYTVETTRFNYPKLLKRFNITCSIDGRDLRTIWKSAAAVSYMDREREWHGFTPRAL